MGVIDEMINELGERGIEAFERNEGEVFRQFVNLIIKKLPIDTERGHATSLQEHKGCYRYDSDLLADIELLQSALLDFGAKTIAYQDVNDTIRLVETFGFHLAHLDIRQNSQFHEKAHGPGFGAQNFPAPAPSAQPDSDSRAGLSG